MSVYRTVFPEYLPRNRCSLISISANVPGRWLFFFSVSPYRSIIRQLDGSDFEKSFMSIREII